MHCNYQIDTSYGYYADPRLCTYSDGPWDKWFGYYHPEDMSINANPIAPYYDGETVGCTSGSYFKETMDPTEVIYISSTISPNDMYAANPNYRNDTY